MSVGFRVLPIERRIAPELVQRFTELPVANVSDAMGRLFAGGAALRPMHAGGVLAGPAITVKARPGDNLMLHKALDIAQPGDVVVVDGSGHLTNALIGEMMTAYAATRGIAGIVIFGAIRDAAAIRASSFPVFAAGVTHRGPYKDGPGEVNVPIAIDGMVINPGDLLLGDDDGLVCVGIEDAEDIYAKASAKHAAENAQMEKIARGENPRAWVDETLKRLGCEGV